MKRGTKLSKDDVPYTSSCSYHFDFTASSGNKFFKLLVTRASYVATCIGQIAKPFLEAFFFKYK
jgi:hypothetical protein